MSISRTVLAIGFGAFISAAPMLALAEGPAPQLSVQAANVQNPQIIEVADGCGWGNYRGPYGGCHQYGTGPYPNGYYNAGPGYYPNGYYAPRPVYTWNGCPPGAWRGPAGFCHY